MEFKLPDFFTDLSGQVICAELCDPGRGELLLPSACSSEVNGTGRVFCRELGLVLNLTSLPAIKAISSLGQEESEQLTVEAIAVFAAGSLLSRLSEIPSVLHEQQASAHGVRLSIRLSPFGQQNEDMLATHLRRMGVEVELPLSMGFDYSGQYTINGEALRGCIPDVANAIRGTAENFAHPLISVLSVDLIVNVLEIDPDVTPTFASAAVAFAYAHVLLSYFDRLSA